LGTSYEAKYLQPLRLSRTRPEAKTPTRRSGATPADPSCPPDREKELLPPTGGARGVVGGCGASSSCEGSCVPSLDEGSTDPLARVPEIPAAIPAAASPTISAALLIALLIVLVAVPKVVGRCDATPHTSIGTVEPVASGVWPAAIGSCGAIGVASERPLLGRAAEPKPIVSAGGGMSVAEGSPAGSASGAFSSEASGSDFSAGQEIGSEACGA